LGFSTLDSFCEQNPVSCAVLQRALAGSAGAGGAAAASADYGGDAISDIWQGIEGLAADCANLLPSGGGGPPPGRPDISDLLPGGGGGPPPVTSDSPALDDTLIQVIRSGAAREGPYVDMSDGGRLWVVGRLGDTIMTQDTMDYNEYVQEANNDWVAMMKETSDYRMSLPNDEDVAAHAKLITKMNMLIWFPPGN